MKVSHIVTVEVSGDAAKRPHRDLLTQIRTMLLTAIPESEQHHIAVSAITWTPTIQEPTHDGKPLPPRS